MSDLNIVTGAFGYTGQAITRHLLASGSRVRTLTNHPNRENPFGPQLEIAPLAFDNSESLRRSLEGADTLFNTYWVRFNHGNESFDRAVRNIAALVRAAEQAGVRRLVHISITNPSLASPFPYFRGKAQAEQIIRESRLSYAILRPTVIFGPGGILINNIAWGIRGLPVFAIPGDGSYRLQPVFLDDLAKLAVCAAQKKNNIVLDAVGPESFSYEELVRLIAAKIGRRARILHVSPMLALGMSRALDLFTRDILLTREEIGGLMANLLVSSAAPAGETRFTDWLTANAGFIGQSYSSELTRHFR
jgi:NADH dehydrogenase